MGNVHLSSDINIPRSSINVIFGHAKVPPGSYWLEKKLDRKRGILVAESLVNIDNNRRVPHVGRQCTVLLFCNISLVFI